METELDFLLELLLNHKLSKPTKDLLQQRIKEVQAQPIPIPRQLVNGVPPRTSRPSPTAQQPSTAAILANNPDLIPEGQEIEVVVEPEVIPVANIAKTPLAAQALNQRQQIMNNRGTGLAQGPSRHKPMSTR